jgi:hypothetical protein
LNEANDQDADSVEFRRHIVYLFSIHLFFCAIFSGLIFVLLDF